MPNIAEPVSIPFGAGIDNRADESDIPEGYVRQAYNIDFTKSLKARRREGYVKRVSGTQVHSLWKTPELDYAVVVIDGYLTRLNDDFSTAQLTAVSASPKMSYCYYNGIIYYSNTHEVGRIVNGVAGQWGLDQPPSPQASPISSGGLEAGEYQITYTYMKANLEESGAPISALVNVPQGGGIQLINIPMAPIDVAFVRVYMSPQDGDELLWARDIPVGIGNYMIGVSELGKELETQFGNRPTPARLVRAFNTRVFIADGPLLWWTIANNPNVIDRRYGWLEFAHTIDVLEPTEDGMYVSEGHRTHFLAGREPTEWSRQLASTHGGIYGTGTQLPSHIFGGLELPMARTAAWVDRDLGNAVLCIGRPGGLIMRMGKNHVAIPAHREGTLAYREKKGIESIIMVLQDAFGSVSTAEAGDSVVATVIRHNITTDADLVDNNLVTDTGDFLITDTGDFLITSEPE